MSETKMNEDFATFLNLFPEVELPLTLSSDHFSTFSKYNKPIPEVYIQKYILNDNSDFEEKELNEDTMDDEYIACFKIPDTLHFVAIVYLKIGLMSYEYYLHTYDEKGKTISKKIIASMTSDGKTIKEHVAFLDEDLVVLMMEGKTEDVNNYNPNDSKANSYLIDDQGNIVTYNL